MMIKRELIIKNENETREFALKLADELKAGDVLALIGDLGTGKTALTKYIAHSIADLYNCPRVYRWQTAFISL